MYQIPVCKMVQRLCYLNMESQKLHIIESENPILMVQRDIPKDPLQHLHALLVGC